MAILDEGLWPDGDLKMPHRSPRARAVALAGHGGGSVTWTVALLASLAAACAPATVELGDFGAHPVSISASDAGAGRPPYIRSLFEKTRIGSDPAMPNYRKATVRLPPLEGWPFSRVTLVVDLETSCFPFSNWKQNPPPPGQYWPADCDAFDRTFEWRLVDAAAPPGTPALELVRAITPFGGPKHLEIDVTDVFNGVRTERDVEVEISTSSDPAGRVTGSAGGWTVSAWLEVEPGTPRQNVLAVLPLLDWRATSGEPGARATFMLPDGTVRTRLEYRATGHGGGTPSPGSRCIGPAEEFCQRTHRVFADEALLSEFTPWRTDCASLCTMVHGDGPTGGGLDYCLENPCGLPESVRAPRANWCPGSVTPPTPLDEPALWRSGGAHSLRVEVDRIDPGGSWHITAAVFAYGP